MTWFEHPLLLSAAIIAVPLIAWIAWRSFASLRAIEANSHPQRRLPLTILSRRTLPLLIAQFCVVATLLLFAAAAPYSLRSADSGGDELVADAHATPGRLLIFVDNSMSMTASDTFGADNESVTRLIGTVAIATTIIDALPNQRIALYSYAGSVHTHSPATSDHAALKQVLLNLVLVAPSIATGSSLSEVLAKIRSEAAHAIDAAESFQVVVIGDGEIPAGFIDDYASELSLLAKTGIPIHTIVIGGVGSSIDLFDPRDRLHNPKQKTNIIGQAVTSREEHHFRRISDATDGKFYLIGEQLVRWIHELESFKESLTDFSGSPIPDPTLRRELAPRLLLLALLFFLLESLALLWFRHRRVERSEKLRQAGKRLRIGRSIAVGKATSILFIFALTLPFVGCQRYKAHAFNESGIALAQIGALGEARNQFERARLLRPGAAVAASNMAGLYAYEGDFQTAHRLYGSALQIAPSRASIHYGDGELLFLWGLSERAECRFDRAEELWLIAAERFAAAADLAQRRTLLRKIYERYLLREPEVTRKAIDNYEYILATVDQLRMESVTGTKDCPEGCLSNQGGDGNSENNDQDQDQDENEGGGEGGVASAAEQEQVGRAEARRAELNAKHSNQGSLRQHQAQQNEAAAAERESASGEAGSGEGAKIWW